MPKRDAIIENYADALQQEHEKTTLHALANEAKPIVTLEELDERVSILRQAVESGELVNEAAVHLGEVVMAFFIVGSDEVEDPQATFNFGAAEGESARPIEVEPSEESEPEDDEPEAESEAEPDPEPEAESEAEPEKPKSRRGRRKKTEEPEAEAEAEEPKGRGRGRGRRGPLAVVND